MKQKHTAILYILLAALFFSGMTAFVHLSGDLPTGQKALFRNLPALFIAAFTLWRKGISPLSVAPVNRRPMFWRCLFGTTGLLCNFYAIDHLVLSDANMLNKLSPFFAILFSIFILREYPKKVDILSVLAAFIGAVFVVRPSAGIASLPSLAGVLGGLGAGAAYTFVRQMSRKGERGPEIVMFFSAFTCVCAIPFFAFNFQPMSAKQWIFLLLAGCAAAGGQLSITAAYRHAPAKEISVFDYSQIVYAALWGFLIFGEIPDALSFVGYAIIIGAAVFRCIFNLRADKKAVQSDAAE